MKVIKLIGTITITACFLFVFPTKLFAATFSLSTDKSKITKDENITVTVQMESTDDVNAVQVNMAYPSDKLKLVSTNTAASAFDVDGPSTGGNGSVQIVRGVIENGIKGTRKIAELKFRALVETGTATISIKTDSAALRGTDQKNVLTTVRGTTITIAKPQEVATVSAFNKDTVPPVISNISVTNSNNNTVTISWRTDEEASSIVQYGLNSSYGLTAQKDERVKIHSVTLQKNNLEAGATYNYQIKSVDEFGNEAKSDNKTFTTVATFVSPSPSTAPATPRPTTPAKVAVKNSNTGSIYIYGGVGILLLVLVLLSIKSHHHEKPAVAVKITPPTPPASPARSELVKPAIKSEIKPEDKTEVKISTPEPAIEKTDTTKPVTQAHEHFIEHHKKNTTPLVKVHEDHNKSYEIKYKTYHVGKK